MSRYKHIFILPILITALAVLILYGFFYQNILDVSAIAENFISTLKLIIPNGFNFKYLILFSGLALMAFTDMLFERISAVIPVFLILAGLIFAYISLTAHNALLTTHNASLTTHFEALGIGLGIFILIDITRLGSYAFGDILTAGAIRAFVGIKNIVIISIFAIILGRVITYIAARLDRICYKSPVKPFHMAFVPVLFLITAVVFALLNKLKYNF